MIVERACYARCVRLLARVLVLIRHSSDVFAAFSKIQYSKSRILKTCQAIYLIRPPQSFQIPALRHTDGSVVASILVERATSSLVLNV